MRIMNKKLQVCLIAPALIAVMAFVFLLSGCVVSKKKLLPDGNYLVLKAPIKPGYYLGHDLSTTNGVRQFKFDGIPYLMTLENGTYTLAKGGFTKQSKTLNGQLFASQDENEIFIAQSQSDQIWQYQRVDVGDDSFVITEQHCSRLDKQYINWLIKQKTISKYESGFCYVNDTINLSALILLADNWKGAPKTFYLAADDKSPIESSRLEDKLFVDPMCDGDPVQALGPGFQGTNQARVGMHMVIMAASTDGPLSMNAVAIEANEGKVGNWAWLSPWLVDNKISCKPHKLVNIWAFRPDKNAFSSVTMSASEVNSGCKHYGYPRTQCGSVNEIVDRLRKRGMHILLQGEEYVWYPNGRYGKKGAYITVMTDVEGLTNKYEVVYTLSDGLSFIYSK